MNFKYSSDMTDLFSDAPKAEMPDELLEFRDYLGHIIGSATVTNEVEFLSPIPCRKKVSRKPCTGFVKVIKQELPESLDGEPNPLVEVDISREEMKALLRGGIYDPDSERIIYSARPAGQGIMLRGLYGDMDNFVGFIASDSNHEEDRKRQKLIDSVYDKVESATSKAYEDAEMGTD
ncbi:MAG: hypothetical protein AABZ06_14960 [Bdellovibrionota bacterium]